jgi:hypothetical protein
MIADLLRKKKNFLGLSVAPARERGKGRENPNWWWRSVHREENCLSPESSH